jgi:hypothetical protein
MISYLYLINGEVLFFFAIIFFFIHGLINKHLAYDKFVDLCFWDVTLILILIFGRIFQGANLNLFICNNAFITNPFLSFMELFCIIILLLLI